MQARPNGTAGDVLAVRDAIVGVMALRDRCATLDTLACAGSGDAAHVLQERQRDLLEAEGRLMFLGIHVNPDGLPCVIDDAA